MAELGTKAALPAVKADLRAATHDLAAHIDTQTRRLTIRFGIMLVVWVAALAAILKLT